MSHYRVAIIEMSRMTREIVAEALRSAGDMDIVAEAQDLSRLPQVVASAHPDIVLTGAEPAISSRVWAELLRSFPPTRMIALTARGGATSFAVAPVKETTEDVSPSQLVDIIRDLKRTEKVH